MPQKILLFSFVLLLFLSLFSHILQKAFHHRSHHHFLPLPHLPFLIFHLLMTLRNLHHPHPEGMDFDKQLSLLFALLHK